MTIMLPRQVLDMHADLTSMFSETNPLLRQQMIEYARKDVETEPGWAYSHLHPASSFEERQMLKWYASLSLDLFGATTFQVTSEMVRLAENMVTMRSNRDIKEFARQELPAPWGFMWLDKPISCPAVDDNGREPMTCDAVSWAQIPGLQAQNRVTSEITTVTGVRLRKWVYSDNPETWPRPLALMGQHTIPLDSRADYTNNVPDIEVIKRIWVLMGMEITSVAPTGTITRAFRKRVQGRILHHEVNVVKLRRTKSVDHDTTEPGPPRNIEWSVCWLVRGHNRRAPNGGTFKDGRTHVWVKPYLKNGDSGLPLKVTDILYKLQR